MRGSLVKQVGHSLSTSGYQDGLHAAARHVSHVAGLAGHARVSAAGIAVSSKHLPALLLLLLVAVPCGLLLHHYRTDSV